LKWRVLTCRPKIGLYIWLQGLEDRWVSCTAKIKKIWEISVKFLSS